VHCPSGPGALPLFNFGPNIAAAGPPGRRCWGRRQVSAGLGFAHVEAKKHRLERAAALNDSTSPSPSSASKAALRASGNWPSNAMAAAVVDAETVGNGFPARANERSANCSDRIGSKAHFRESRPWPFVGLPHHWGAWWQPSRFKLGPELDPVGSCNPQTLIGFRAGPVLPLIDASRARKHT